MKAVFLNILDFCVFVLAIVGLWLGGLYARFEMGADPVILQILVPAMTMAIIFRYMYKTGVFSFAAVASLFLVTSCTGGASVTRTAKGGYHATSGYTLLAKRENVVAEVVTREGDVIRYSTTSEDSTEVPNTAIWWWGTARLAKINQPSVLKGTEDKTAVELGKQDVQKTQITADKDIKLGQQALDAVE